MLHVLFALGALCCSVQSSYLAPPPSVQLLNSSLAPALDIGSAVDCVISVVPSDGVLLFGTVDVKVNPRTGMATFNSVALVAPLRTAVTFRALCVTSAGATNAVTVTSHVYGVQLEWQQLVEPLLFNTAPAVAPSVRARFVLSDGSLQEIPPHRQLGTECTMQLYVHAHLQMEYAQCLFPILWPSFVTGMTPCLGANGPRQQPNWIKALPSLPRWLPRPQTAHSSEPSRHVC